MSSQPSHQIIFLFTCMHAKNKYIDIPVYTQTAQYTHIPVYSGPAYTYIHINTVFFCCCMYIQLFFLHNILSFITNLSSISWAVFICFCVLFVILLLNKLSSKENISDVPQTNLERKRDSGVL